MPSRIPAYRPPRLREQEQPRKPDNRETAAQRGYCDKRHRAWRAAVLLRDSYECQDCGKVIAAKGEAHADHITPIRQGGDRYDIANGQCLCASCHSKKTLAETRGIPVSRRPWSAHPDWMPRSAIPVTLVCGPPAAGKNTFVTRHASSGELLIDLDAIGSSLLGKETKAWSKSAYAEAMRARNNMLASLHRKNVVIYPRAWFIASEPEAKWRQWWVDKLGVDRVVVVETPQEICEARIAADRSRESQRGAAVNWWKRYHRRDGDEAVTDYGSLDDVIEKTRRPCAFSA